MTNAANAPSPYRAAPAMQLPAREATAPFAATLADASLGEIVFQGALTGVVHAPATGGALYGRLAIFPVIGISLIVGVGVIPNFVGRYDSDRTAVGCVFGSIFFLVG